MKTEGDGRGVTEERRSAATRRARCDGAPAVWERRCASAARRMPLRRHSLRDRGTHSVALPGRRPHSIHEDRQLTTRHVDGQRRARPDSPPLAGHHRARGTCRSPRAQGVPRPATARSRLRAIGTSPRVALARIYELPVEAPLPTRHGRDPGSKRPRRVRDAWCLTPTPASRRHTDMPNAGWSTSRGRLGRSSSTAVACRITVAAAPATG